MGHLKRGARYTWGAVWCSALLLLLLLLCLLKLSACVPYRAASSVSRPISPRLCARTAATAAWASMVVCGIAALAFSYPASCALFPAPLSLTPSSPHPRDPHSLGPS